MFKIVEVMDVWKVVKETQCFQGMTAASKRDNK